MATNTTKIVLALTLVLAANIITFSQAHAELTIWQVENNPPGTDDGAEWFTLINTGSNDTFDGYSIKTTNGQIGFYSIPTITLGTCEYHKITLPKQTIDNQDDTVRLIKDGITVYETPVINDTKNNNSYWTNPDVASICGETQADAAKESGVNIRCLGDESGCQDWKEPHIPEWISNFTQYYTDGLITADEYTTAIRYLLDEGVIYLGESPQVDNPELVYGTVTQNVDGNTIHIDNVNIRIPLVDVQDSGNHTMPHAVLAKLLCPVDSPAMYDIDDKQKQDMYERTIAVVYCNTELSLGEVMIGFGLGWIGVDYCNKSEFEFADWTHGSCWH